MKKLISIPKPSHGFRLVLTLLFFILGARPVLADQTVSRIHVITLPGSSEAILLESRDSDGMPIFGLIDTGEDEDYPDGSNPDYIYRPGTIRGNGNDEEVLSYLDTMGVTSTNLKFLVCTHPHSDHIGLADTIISTYLPSIVYLPLYSDRYIRNSDRLWDNAYVYAQAYTACAEHEEVTLVQHLDPGSENPAEHPDFSFGSFQVSIVNYEEDYLQTPKADANQFSLGVIVKTNEHICLIPSDMDNTDGDLERLTASYDLADLDVLLSNHHGYLSANPPEYLRALHPSCFIQTGRFSNMQQETLDLLKDMGTQVYSVAGFYGLFPSVVVDFSEEQISCSADHSMMVYTDHEGQLLAYQNGRPYSGFFDLEDSSFYADENGLLKRDTLWRDPDSDILYAFNDCCQLSPAENSLSWVCENDIWYYETADGLKATGWMSYNDHYYYLTSDGQMATGWLCLNGKWHYFAEWGGLITGWTQIGSDYFYLDPEDNGAMAQNRWYQDETGAFHYLQSWGAAARNTVHVIDTYTYSFDDNAMVSNIQWLKRDSYLQLLVGSRIYSGWADLGGNFYYLNSDGTLKRNSLFEEDDQLYYVDEKGKRASDTWMEISGKWYFFRPNGAAYTNCWFVYKGKTYWMNRDGSRQTGWMIRKDKTYYFDEEGVMYTGMKQVDGKTYIFDSRGVLK